MKFNWGDFLKIAKKLKSESGEGALRTSISRAYYAIFHTSMDWGENFNSFKRSQDGTDHQNIKINLNQFNRTMGRKFGRIQDNRRQADYKSEISNPQSLAEITFSEAESLMNDFVQNSK
jgi:uncharacterized protein (UPF0332 family)